MASMRLVDVDELGSQLTTLTSLVDVIDDYQRKYYGALSIHKQTPGDSGAIVVEEVNRTATRVSVLICLAQEAADAAEAVLKAATVPDTKGGAA
jgi:hypothetical protein